MSFIFDSSLQEENVLQDLEDQSNQLETPLIRTSLADSIITDLQLESNDVEEERETRVTRLEDQYRIFTLDNLGNEA